jgi:hypothetical protein
MSWANQEVYKLIIALPDEALKAYATDPEWTVGEILRHIAAASGGYGARLKSVAAEVLVRPTIIDPGNFYVHQGEVNFDIKPGSIISGLKPLTKPVIHRHAKFKICVGDNVETIQGIR